MTNDRNGWEGKLGIGKASSSPPGICVAFIISVTMNSSALQCVCKVSRLLVGIFGPAASLVGSKEMLSGWNYSYYILMIFSMWYEKSPN